MCPTKGAEISSAKLKAYRRTKQRLTHSSPGSPLQNPKIKVRL
jgi:hypothetical protein